MTYKIIRIDGKDDKLTAKIFNQEFIEEIIRLTWRNPAFMAIAIALIWLIPQLFIRKIMEKKYEQRKIEIQKNKIQKLYPTNTPK